MFMEKQIEIFRTLDNWFLSDQGVPVAQAFTQELICLKKMLHGNILLQLGNCAENPWLESLRFQRKWIFSPYLCESAELVSSLTQLPLERDSVNSILVPLTVDAFCWNENPLDEIDRILKPMGHVVFIGINPVSLWGCWLRMSQHSCLGSLRVWSKSVLSITHAMEIRGYVQRHLSSFYYVPPVSNKKWIEKLKILNATGKMISPLPAAFYCLVVQKFQEDILRPARVPWKERLVNVPVSSMYPVGH